MKETKDIDDAPTECHGNKIRAFLRSYLKYNRY